MRRFFAIIVASCGVAAGYAVAQSPGPVPIRPSELRWLSPPNVSGLQAAWVLGAENIPGPYILRVQLAAGARIPPHTHPDERNTTVLAGTIYVGFGERFDETKVVAVSAGEVFLTPANLAHYVWARDAAATYQEAGIAPTATAFIEQ